MTTNKERFVSTFKYSQDVDSEEQGITRSSIEARLFASSFEKHPRSNQIVSNKQIVIQVSVNIQRFPIPSADLRTRVFCHVAKEQ